MVNIFLCTINISIKCRKTLVSPTAGWQREEQAVWQGAGGHGILLHRHGAHPRVQVWTTHWIFKEGLLHRHGAHPIEFRFGLGIRYARMDSFPGSGLILEFRLGLCIGYAKMDSFTGTGLLLQLRFWLHIEYSRMDSFTSSVFLLELGLDYALDML